VVISVPEIHNKFINYYTLAKTSSSGGQINGVAFFYCTGKKKIGTIPNFRNGNFRKIWYGTDRFYFSGKLRTLARVQSGIPEKNDFFR